MESTALESGVHGFGIRDPANGIQNQKFVIQPLKRVRNPRMWNPESTHMESGIQDSLGLPYMGQSFVEEEGY